MWGMCIQNEELGYLESKLLWEIKAGWLLPDCSLTIAPSMQEGRLNIIGFNKWFIRDPSAQKAGLCILQIRSSHVPVNPSLADRALAVTALHTWPWNWSTRSNTFPGPGAWVPGNK